jgi:hypothetical protein
MGIVGSRLRGLEMVYRYSVKGIEEMFEVVSGQRQIFWPHGIWNGKEILRTNLNWRLSVVIDSYIEEKLDV